MEADNEQQGAFEPLMYPQPNRDDAALVNVSWCAFTKTINLNCISGFMLIDGITGNSSVLVDADGARVIAEYRLEPADRIGGK